MQPEFELNHLKYFYYTVLEGGVTTAAQTLNVQQPVVSKMLKSLDEQFGQPLFWKEGRSKVLTDFGQLVFRHCQVIFGELSTLEQIQKGKNHYSGVLNIGAAEPITAHIIPNALVELRQDFSHTHYNIYTATSSQLLEMITSHKLDIGLFFHIPDLNENLEIIKRIGIPFRLVIHRDYKNNKKTIESFIGSREIDDTATHKFPTVELIRKKYPKTKIILSSNHLGFHREMVLRGQGVSILPEFLVEKDIKKGILVDIFSKKKFIFDLKIVKRKSGVLSPLENKLISLI